MSMIPRVKGTQDFIDCAIFNFIVDQFAQHVSLYHFQQIATPVLEHVELFKRSLGQHTDVVSKEMFIVQSANESQEQICLRPEATAATVRAFVENNPTTPWKVYSYGPMFRYERPQKGRFRQFHQINLEVIGAQSISQDVQIITMLDRFFHEKLKLNNYSLQINFLGTVADRANYLKTLKSFLTSAQGICATCTQRATTNPLRIFDCKVEECQKIYQKAPHIADHLSTESKQEWEQLKQELMLLSISFVYNPKLVRGLDYYNKTVFEFASENLGAQNAFCGGGRYDQLAKELGAREDQPSIGAAIGIERLMLLLEPIRDTLPIAQSRPLYVMMPLSQAQQPLALLLADTLHAANLVVDTLLDGDSLKSMMRKANKMGAVYALILGDQEQQNKTVVVKNMMTGEQHELAQVDLATFLKR